MPRFPLPFVPTRDYHRGGLRFGAKRGGRKHAACDLIAPPGTPVYAVKDGIVIRGPRYFYHDTYSIVVHHTNFIVRYGEIYQKVPEGIYEGAKVEEGQIIAHVGKMYHSSMLHFEMYSGAANGEYSQKGKNAFNRREDLIDPTPYLDAWRLMTPFSGYIDAIDDAIDEYVGV